MKKGKKIGWQKYEDIIEAQLKSPLSTLFFASLGLPIGEEDNDREMFQDENEEENAGGIVLSIPESLSTEIQLTTNFDCWVGHTNFNITEQVKDKINKIEGVEILKIYSRYRFFVGIGRMFDFKDVRKDIEQQLTGNQNV